MSNFPITFADELRELPPSLSADNNEHAADLAERGFIVLSGLTRVLQRTVAVMGAEGHIRRFCLKDATDARFATEEAATEWHKKGDRILNEYGRGFFSLMKTSTLEPELYGYGWTGPETSDKVPGGKTTFAERIGQIGIGKKLAIPFGGLMVAATAELYDADNIWLETWQSNHAAHVYERIGFIEVPDSATPDGRPTISGDKVPDTRLYMTFPNDQLPH